jgi:hypothetical protein
MVANGVEKASKCEHRGTAGRLRRCGPGQRDEKEQRYPNSAMLQSTVGCTRRHCFTTEGQPRPTGRGERWTSKELANDCERTRSE